MTTFLLLTLGFFIGFLTLLGAFIVIANTGDDEEFTEPQTVIPDYNIYDLNYFTLDSNNDWYIVCSNNKRIQSYEKSVYNMIIDGNKVHFSIK